MFPHLTARQKAATFYVLTFTFALLIAAAVPDSSDGGQLLTMFTPLVAVLLLLLVVTRDGYRTAGWTGLGLGRLGIRAWPRALLVPTAVVTVSYLIAMLLGLARFTEPAWNGGADLLVSLLLSLVLGLAEEIGWRGYMLPLLTPSGPRRACLTVGFLHGAWHLPLMILTTTYNPLGNRAITIPVMLLVFAGAGVFYGQLRLASASIWPVVVAHQGFNSVSEWFDASTTTDHPTALAYTVGETGLVTLVLVAMVAAVLLRDPRRWPTLEPAATTRAKAQRIG